jgi:hypothetical protein
MNRSSEIPSDPFAAKEFWRFRLKPWVRQIHTEITALPFEVRA